MLIQSFVINFYIVIRYTELSDMAALTLLLRTIFYLSMVARTKNNILRDFSVSVLPVEEFENCHSVLRASKKLNRWKIDNFFEYARRVEKGQTATLRLKRQTGRFRLS